MPKKTLHMAASFSRNESTGPLKDVGINVFVNAAISHIFGWAFSQRQVGSFGTSRRSLSQGCVGPLSVGLARAFSEVWVRTVPSHIVRPVKREQVVI